MDIDSIDKQLHGLYLQINKLKCQQKELETYKKIYMIEKLKSCDIATVDIYQFLDMCSNNTKELVKSAIMCDLENQTKNLTRTQKGRRIR